MTEVRWWPARQVQMGQSSSLCVMPHAATLTSTSQNMGWGSGTSSRTSPPMPVRSWVRMAFIVSSLRVDVRWMSSSPSLRRSSSHICQGSGANVSICWPHGRDAVSRTVADVLRPALRHRPDAPAIIARSGTLTYADLDRAAAAAAGAMWQLGVRPGDRVAACLPNDLDVVVAFHGAQRIGAIWVGINEAFTADEQQALADLAAPSLILAGPRSQAEGGI